MDNIVSIIIVQYKSEDDVIACIASIKKAKTTYQQEIIVVDNNPTQHNQRVLKQKFPDVSYIKNKKNNGFGAGNNIGATYAHGKYLFFLNPDTLVFPQTVNILINFLKKNMKTGVVAPLLLTKDKKVFPLQGSLTLTPLRAVAALSFIYKYFPNNPIAKSYFLTNWNKESIQYVDVVPGTACIIRREVFEQVGGFDESFFLYFEESDLCKRIKEKGFFLSIIPQAKIIHISGQSTKYLSNIKDIFIKSRFHYFRKHYGYLQAVFVEAFCRFSLSTLLHLK